MPFNSTTNGFFLEIKEFVQSSGKDGSLVFSLRSVIQNLPEKKGIMIALALIQITRKVW